MKNQITYTKFNGRYPSMSSLFKSRNKMVDVLKERIIRAIKNGNHETKYIFEACHCDFKDIEFAEAMQELRLEGVIIYKDYLEGYYFA